MHYFTAAPFTTSRSVQDVYNMMNIISPWLVGRFSDTNSFDDYFNNVFVDDAKQTDANNQGYAPVVFPGFSWSNLQKTPER